MRPYDVLGLVVVAVITIGSIVVLSRASCMQPAPPQPCREVVCRPSLVTGVMSANRCSCYDDRQVLHILPNGDVFCACPRMP